jgi:hypothetical protein
MRSLRGKENRDDDKVWMANAADLFSGSHVRNAASSGLQINLLTHVNRNQTLIGKHDGTSCGLQYRQEADLGD